jgi:tetratricopeptide (TPR) repeat protein
MGEYARAETLLSEALDLFYKEKNKKGSEIVLCNLGAVRGYLGEYNLANKALSNVLEAIRENGDEYSLAVALNNMAIILWEQGDMNEAEAYLEKSLELSEGLTLIGDRLRIELLSAVLDNLSQARYYTNGWMEELFSKIPDGVSLEDISILKGWKMMLEARKSVYHKRWEEAWELVEGGERLIENLGHISPSNFTWLDKRMVENNVD